MAAPHRLCGCEQHSAPCARLLFLTSFFWVICFISIIIIPLLLIIFIILILFCNTGLLTLHVFLNKELDFWLSFFFLSQIFMLCRCHFLTWALLLPLFFSSSSSSSLLLCLLTLALCLTRFSCSRGISCSSWMLLISSWNSGQNFSNSSNTDIYGQRRIAWSTHTREKSL